MLEEIIEILTENNTNKTNSYTKSMAVFLFYDFVLRKKIQMMWYKILCIYHFK